MTPNVARSPAVSRGASPQPKGLNPQRQTPSPPPPAMPVASGSLPSARQLARVQAAKAEALLAAGQALRSAQEQDTKFAVPGKDAAVVKQFLAQAGMLVNISVHAYNFQAFTTIHAAGHVSAASVG